MKKFKCILKEQFKHLKANNNYEDSWLKNYLLPILYNVILTSNIYFFYRLFLFIISYIQWQ